MQSFVSGIRGAVSSGCFNDLVSSVMEFCHEFADIRIIGRGEDGEPVTGGAGIVWLGESDYVVGFQPEVTCGVLACGGDGDDDAFHVLPVQ